MAFKTVKSYNEEKFGGMFLLRDNGDYADVVFMYQKAEDVLVADTHYVKSADYSGYVHCCGRGCPACAKGIRVQTKLFIPLYNIKEGEIQFFDRTMRFEPQLNKEVFANYPNPSEYVFRITRNGVAGDVNTTYSIMAVGKNTMPFAQILADNNAKFPEYYENICRDISSDDLYKMLNSSSSDAVPSGDMPNYQVTPRAVSASVPTAPYIPVPDTSAVAIPDVNLSDTDVDADAVDALDDDNVDF